MTGTNTQFFVPGGTLKPTAEAYVERTADTEFYRALNAGEFCFVLTSRQMGKSSLMARTAARLRSEGFATAIVDLTGITEAKNPDATLWYRGVCRRIAQDVGLVSGFDRWWKSHQELSQVQRFTEFLETFVLDQIGAARLIIFVDEIDATLRLKFADDFFAAIRACYNARATSSQFERLAFALLGVASPSDLIKDSSRTPFNIGQRIHLNDFTLNEALTLTAGFDCDEATSRRILSRILYWTDGQPYLTQRLCLEVAQHGNGNSNGEVVSWETEDDNLVHNLFFAPEASREEVHFKYIRDRLMVDPRLPAILREYRGVLEGGSIRDAPQSLIHTSLKLAGLVKVDPEGHLRIRNRIYERVFDKTWVKQVMPANWTRRVALASPALLLLLLGAWWLVIRPSELAQQIRQADRDVPKSAFEKLRSIPLRRQQANQLMAEYWDRRALRSEVQDSADNAFIYRLKALGVLPNDNRRRAAGEIYLARERRLKHRFAQRGPVTAVAFSPDGRVLLIGCQDGAARLWDAASGKPVGRPLQHRGPVTAVAFSPDGRVVLTGSDDLTARLWDAASGKPLGQPLWHHGRVTAVAFSPDGGLLLTGSEDGAARLWDAATGKPIGQPLQHLGRVTAAVAFSPDGRVLLTGSWDGAARLWDKASGKPIGQPFRHQGPVTAVAFSPDGGLLLTGSEDGAARLWDTASGKSLGQPLQDEGRVIAVAFSPDGRLALTGSRDGAARLWDAASGKPIGPPLQNQGSVTAVAFSPDGRLLLTGSWDGAARLWDAASGKPIGQPLQHQGPVTAVAFSPDSRVLLTCSWVGAAQLWDAASGKPIGPPLQHKDWVTAVAFSPDGRVALTGSWDGSARLWDAASGKPIGQPLQHQGPVTTVAFSPDGRLVLTGCQDGAARLWDAASGKPIGQPIQHQGSVTTVAFSPDGGFITTTTSDARLHRFQIATGAARQTATLWCYGVSINSPHLLNTTGSRVRVWDFVTGNYVLIRDINFDTLESAPIQGQPADLLREWLDVTALKFSEDGGTLIDRYPPPPLVSPKELDLSPEKKQRGSL